tara:strand:- start:558 stop:704 length:147 start_codon:yes stop_codon:yes gene_type:complete
MFKGYSRTIFDIIIDNAVESAPPEHAIITLDLLLTLLVMKGSNSVAIL